MKINSQTKISALIKHNEKSIEAIASINSHFKKLRNPILRKLLATRVTISDAARIGKCDILVLYEKLREIGFDIECNVIETPKTNAQMMPAIIREAIQKTNIIELDVRPILASGTDPFKTIMGTFKKLPDESTLKLINTFEPIPLIKILNEKGYTSFVERQDDLVITWFKMGVDSKTTPQKNESTGTIVEYNAQDFEDKIIAAGEELKTIDVRSMEMPTPMIRTVETLEELKQGEQLLVIHRRIPKYLFIELQNLKYDTCYTVVTNDMVKILINKWNR